ncbi:pyrroloquinoline quinone biosynthesis protein PqqB [Cohnella caldifontis]|uniref:pyrroloquinoline quinone biosynthesis protein PqqB n=1 Tax=Cohnella caldifontis TaxID=3027471 RepID=UPI0023EC082A|nr:pyrroloquinoline quinone biosynthesis protein PqqB [Cohnella sp. YIM B05605]
MRIRLLGSAAGGGLPQWNCACPNCAGARAGQPVIARRMNDSLAVSADGSSWYLINASPDVCAQLEAYPAFHPSALEGKRGSPIRGVLLTDAELDHTIGLLQLRQGAELEVYAASPVMEALSGLFPIQRIVEPYACFEWLEIRPGDWFPLFGGRIKVCPFRLGGKPPRYAASISGSAEASAWVVGYRLEDTTTGGAAVYAPGLERWTPELEEMLRGADCLLLDGTFWRSDELRCLGIGGLTAAEMGHVPLTGPDGGTLSRLAGISAARKALVHLNNTNPILREDAEERLQALRLGIEIGYDGWEAEV